MIDEVTQVLFDAADTSIRPRFRQLTKSQISEEAPNDLVTVADVEAERLISCGLLEILDIPVVGEEAVATDPSRLAALGGGHVGWWILSTELRTSYPVVGNTR